MKRNDGNASVGIVGLLAVLAVFAALGAWNYHRNLGGEEQVFRPYRGVSETELAQLLEAYRGEVDRAGARYGAARGGAGQVRSHQLLSDRLDEFERVRRRSERTRELGAHASELESTLILIEKETGFRESERNRVALFLKRLLTI